MEKFNKKTKIKKVYKNIIASLSLILLIFIIINIGDKKEVKIGEISINEYNVLAGNEKQVETGKVTVKYLDTEGNILQDDTILTGNIGDVYITSRPEISAFKAYGKDPVNKIGNYDRNDVSVTYVYTRKNANVNINNENNVVTVQIIDEQQTVIPEIKMSIVTQKENGESLTGGKYKIKDANNLIIREATMNVEKLLVGSIQLTEEGKERYYISEVVNPEGYELLKEEIEVELTKTLNSSNTYDVTAKILAPSENVSVEVINDEIIITIIAKEEKVEEQKLFDLEIINSITEIEVFKADASEKYSKKSEEDIIKIDLPKSEIEKIEMEATYKLTITNVGELSGYATQITSEIPQGMELVEYNGWVKDGNIGKNTTLKETLLHPGESVILYIKLRWQPDEENIGIKLDKAIISNSISEENTDDYNYANDEDDESFVISVRTGISDYIHIVEIVLIVLIIVTIIVANLRKNKVE